MGDQGADVKVPAGVRRKSNQVDGRPGIADYQRRLPGILKLRQRDFQESGRRVRPDADLAEKLCTFPILREVQDAVGKYDKSVAWGRVQHNCPYYPTTSCGASNICASLITIDVGAVASA